MSRVFHIHDQSDGPVCPGDLVMMAQHIRATPERGHEVYLVGPEPTLALARELGIGPARRVRAVFHRATWAARRLRDAIGQAGPRDVACPWSPGARAFAGMMLRGVPRVSSSVVTPSVHADALDGSTRHAYRRRWRVGDREHVVALLADRPGDTQAMPATIAVGLARDCLAARGYTDHDISILMHPDTPGLSKTLRMIRDLGWRGGLIQEADMTRPWRVMPAVDVALALGTSGAATAVLWAAAADVPILAERGGTITDRLARDDGAVRVEPGLPREAGHALTELLADPARGTTLAAAARSVADRHYGLDATAADLRLAYEQAGGT